MATTPSWLDALANAVTPHIHPADFLSPIGCHTFYNADEDQWEITIFASNTEVIGGRLDGKRTASRFAVDVRGVCELFGEVSRLEWQSHRLDPDDDLGAHISIEGTVDGFSVWLRILAQAPDRFEVGRYVYTDEPRVECVW